MANVGILNLPIATSLTGAEYAPVVQGLGNDATTRRAQVSQFDLTGGTPGSVQTANTVFAGPVSGPADFPAFRALVAADIPNGLPVGGTTGQLLVKASGANYDVTWADDPVVPQAANTFLGGPVSGGAADPTFRLLTTTDLPQETGGFYTDTGTAPTLWKGPDRQFGAAGSANSGAVVAGTGETYIYDAGLGYWIERNAATMWLSPNGGNGGLFATRTSDRYTYFYPGATVWEATTAESLNDILGYQGRVYQVTTAGTTSASPPVHTTGSAANGSTVLLFLGFIPTSPIGLQSVLVNDSVNDGQGSWNRHSVVARLSADAGTTFGEEMDLANFGDSIANTPYSTFPAGATVGYTVAAGYDPSLLPSVNPSSCGVLLYRADNTFLKGIVYGALCIDGTDGVTGTGIAEAFARGHTIQWYGAGGVAIGGISNTVDDTNNRINLLMDDSGANTGSLLVTRAGTTILSVEHGAGASASANFARTISSAAGSAPEIRGGGSDAAVGLKLNTKTTGEIELQTANTTRAIVDTTGIRLPNTFALKTAQSAGNTALIQAYDVDGTAYVTFATLTANDTPTMDLSDAVTKAGGYIYRAGGTDIPVADGGTGLSSGTSGGVLGFTAAGTLASSVALTANALVLGGGAGATPTPLASLGTTTTVLHGNAAGAPTFGAVSLTADVSGTLPVANGGTGNTALGALTRVDDTNVTLTLGGSPTTALVNAASITAGWSGQLAVARGGTAATTARGACTNLGTWNILAASAVGSSHTGDTNETTLATVQVPAAAMGANGFLRITTLWSMTSSGNNKTVLIRFNGTGGTAYYNQTVTTSGEIRDQRMIANRNSASSQVGLNAAAGNGGWAQTNLSPLTTAVNTASAVDIVFRCLLANTGETITLESYMVEILSQA